MELDNIKDDEMLYRVVKNSDPNGFIDGKPTAALFIDKGGTSVERDGDREEPEVVENLITRFNRRSDYKTAVKIAAGMCREVGTYPTPIGNNKNKYHAEIHESEKVVEISFLKALQLAALCREVVTQE